MVRRRRGSGRPIRFRIRSLVREVAWSDPCQATDADGLGDVRQAIERDRGTRYGGRAGRAPAGAAPAVAALGMDVDGWQDAGCVGTRTRPRPASSIAALQLQSASILTCMPWGGADAPTAWKTKLGHASSLQTAARDMTPPETAACRGPRPLTRVPQYPPRPIHPSIVVHQPGRPGCLQLASFWRPDWPARRPL